MTLTAEQQRMVADNLGLITFTMNTMCGIRREHPLFDDLWQDGAIGLARSTTTFDPTRNIRFSTYATYWIRQAVQRGQATMEGANYRHARYKGQEYERPKSLDATHDADHELTLGSTVLVDPCDVERVACGDVDCARIVADMGSCARDDVDRALIAAGIEHPNERPTFRDKKVAAQFGMIESTVRRRRLALAARYRSLVAA